MRVITGLLAGIGFLVVLLFLAAIGLFAFDEVKRRMAGAEGEIGTPEETPGA